MKKYLCMMVVVLSFLTGCSESTVEETALKIKQAQVKLEENQKFDFMKLNRKAIFEEHASYGENCKTGVMKWVDNNIWSTSVYTVVCTGIPTTSLQYRSGKQTINEVTIGESLETPEEIAKRVKGIKDDNVKKEALSKLTPEEKLLLGLK